MAELTSMPSIPKLYAQAAAKGASHQLKSALTGTPLGGLLKKVPLGGSSKAHGNAVLPTERVSVSGQSIERQKLVSYQRLMKDTVRDELPSVFLHAAAFPVALAAMSTADFPLPLMGMVHLKNVVEHRRVVAPEEILNISAWTENLQAHYAGTQFDAVAEISVGDEVVWRGVSTYLSKGTFLAGKPERPEREERDTDTPQSIATWKLSGDTGRDYAEVSGDFNPIHLGTIPAKIAGMKGAIVHGMYSAGRALAATAPNGQPYEWSIEFEAPVFLPAIVAFEAHASGETGKTEFSGWNAKNQRRHFVGWVARR
ncbi:MaoC/PaaZ C-terminal domain-containing protein [Neomicrococcus lactis]